MSGWRSTKDGRHFRTGHKPGISSDNNNNSPNHSGTQPSSIPSPTQIMDKKREIKEKISAMKSITLNGYLMKLKMNKEINTRIGYDGTVLIFRWEALGKARENGMTTTEMQQMLIEKIGLPRTVPDEKNTISTSECQGSSTVLQVFL